jgi:hypothetical protein
MQLCCVTAVGRDHAISQHTDKSIASIPSMIRRSPHPSTRLLALLLLCSLLAAQWIGLQHRVAHASLPYAGITHGDSDLDGKNMSDGNLFHSCLLLDANAVGASLPGCEYIPVLPRHAALPITILPLVSWQALFTRQFSSRAPPSLS